MGDLGVLLFGVGVGIMLITTIGWLREEWEFRSRSHLGHQRHHFTEEPAGWERHEKK